MPSKFNEISRDLVATGGDACAAVMSSLKHKENLTICTALMDKANSYGSEGKNQYKAEAFRRAAILVARSEIPLLNKKTTETCHNWKNCVDSIGLPNAWHSSTTEFIYIFIKLPLLKKTISWNKFEAFPPEWRDESLIDDCYRIHLAKNMIHWLIHPIKSSFWGGIHRDINYKTDILYKQAYDFYSKYNYYSWITHKYYLLEFLQETINTIQPE